MAKFDINFNNKNYSIDETSLSPATSALRQHLSTTMSGSGVTIALGGTSYNIDSVKLAEATSEFVSHLRTIAGDGYKVVVDGVEYSFDATKVQSAISELHDVLGSLHTGGGEAAQPEKNKYGFYFNVPYVVEYNSDDYSYTCAHVFYDDGTVVSFYSGISDDATPYASGDGHVIDYENLADSGFAFSEDGKTVLDYDGNTCTTQDIIEHGAYFGETYICQDGEAIVPYATGEIDFIGDGSSYRITLEGWKAKGHYGQNYAYRVYVTIDGSAIYAGSRYDVLKMYYLDAPKLKLETPVVSIVNETLNIEPVLNAEAYEVYCEDALVATTSSLTVDLSQYITEKNTYLLIRAIGDEYEPSDFVCFKYGAEFIAGLYQTGAISLYEAGDYAAIEDMLITSWGELIIDKHIIQEDTSLNKGSSLIHGDLIMPNGIITVDRNAFENCDKITGVVLPDGLTTISNSMFLRCKSLSTVIIPDSVSQIDNSAFCYCESLTHVTIPDGVTSIDTNAFDGCYALTTVSLPDSVIYIGSGAFAYCNQLENIIYRGTAEQWKTIELVATGNYPWNNWNYEVPATYVQCSDGQVAL